ncbi:MAG TPA: ATP-binding protein [Blastocatellia bacterium]|nr:ATP-binding protein [Blastocatellia bacterium]
MEGYSQGSGGERPLAAEAESVSIRWWRDALPLSSPGRETSPLSRTRRLRFRATLTALVMTALFGGFEVAKLLLFPTITPVHSHLLSALAVTALTLVTAHYVLRKQERLIETTARTNHLLQTVLAAIPEAIVIVDRRMEVVLHNRAAEHIFSLPVTLGRPLRLMDVTRDGTVNEAFHHVLSEGRTVEGRFELLSGERRSFRFTVSPLEADGRRPSAALGVFVEVTHLERLERIRRDFFANISHELRTPLAAILAHAETLRQGALDDRENSLRFLDAIYKYAQRMHALVRDITDLSEIESGVVTLKLEDIDLRSVVEDVMALLLPAAEERGVTLTHEVSDDILVRADVSRLEQILTNLVDNAVKFNRPGGQVTIRAHREGAWVVLSVKDTGVGIAPADQPRIFERFYRADKSRSRQTGGSGLGLAIVKHLVQAHGGQVKVSSKPGVGSEFTVTLPAANDVSPRT